MKIFLSGHYSNDFLKEIAGNLILDRLKMSACKLTGIFKDDYTVRSEFMNYVNSAG